MNVTISNHALKRMQQRSIDELMIEAARCFGEKIYAKNSLYFFLGKRAMKRLLKVFRPQNPEKWEGLTVVCDPKNEKVLTVFKNKNWLKKIRSK
ncbi:MAG: DUF4258 domain-containing protein [Caldisericaceae bacterium]|nr:DUF4258 domain-containing protein [Caldisericaceae bacterium]